MPKKQIFEGIVIIIILSFICMYIYDNYKVEKKISIIINESEKCAKTLKKYYTDKYNNNYFLYCLDNIIIDYSDRTLEFDKALEAKQIKNDYLINNASKNNEKSTDKYNYYESDNYSIIECKMKDNNNYIIGNTSLNYSEGMCDENPYTYTFIKEYYVMDITTSKTNDIYLTLKDEQLQEVSTIKLDSKYIATFKQGSYYNFKFASASDDVDNIEKNFKENILLNIEKVEKNINIEE